MASLGEYIKELREQKGIGLNSFAKEMGVSAGNVSEWENKGKTPRPEVLKKIAEYFEIDFEILRNLKKGNADTGKSHTSEKYDKFYKLMDVKELLVDKAISNVTRREVAKLMAKVYDKPLETILDELLQSDVLELDDIRKQK